MVEIWNRSKGRELDTMTNATQPAAITCADCKESFDYDDDTVDGVGSADCLPDGYLLPNGEWVCADCKESEG